MRLHRQTLYKKQIKIQNQEQQADRNQTNSGGPNTKNARGVIPYLLHNAVGQLMQGYTQQSRLDLYTRLSQCTDLMT